MELFAAVINLQTQWFAPTVPAAALNHLG